MRVLLENVRGHRHIHTRRPYSIAMASSETNPKNRRAAKSAIIVGGGIGGLVTAGKLAKEGLQVTLLEQNEQVGPRSNGQYCMFMVDVYESRLRVMFGLTHESITCKFSGH